MRHLQRQLGLQAFGFGEANHGCRQVAPLFEGRGEQAVTDVIADRIAPRAKAKGARGMGRAGTFFSTVAIKEEDPNV
jgi:hypothetical protein